MSKISQRTINKIGKNIKQYEKYKNKILLPKQQDIRDFLNTPSTQDPFINILAQESTACSSLFNLTIQYEQGKDLFKTHLLKIGFLKNNSSSDLKLYYPPDYECVANYKDPNLLFEKLSEKLLSFFQKEHMILKPKKSIKRIHESASILLKHKEMLVDIGVNEDDIEETAFKICSWEQKLTEKLILKKKVPATRHDLVRLLFPIFLEFQIKRRDKKLSKDHVFSFIADVLKYFGIENGDTRNIAANIKIDYYRKEREIE